jgi:hypothetical protein
MAEILKLKVLNTVARRSPTKPLTQCSEQRERKNRYTDELKQRGTRVRSSHAMPVYTHTIT